MMLRKFAAVAAVVGFVFSAAAELPEGYSPLQYIQSDGTAYIDTGYKPNGSTKIEMIADFCIKIGGDHYIFGASDAKVKSGVGLGADSYSTTLYVHVPGTSYLSLNNPFSATEWQTYRFFYTNGVMEVENQARGVKAVHNHNREWVSGGFDTYQFVNSIYLFTRHGDANSLDTICTGNSETRMTSFKVWEDDTLVRDLVPAKRDSDETIGFYDLADHSGEPGYSPFYTSPRGTLTTGLDPKYLVGKHRLDYLESDGAQDINTKIVFKDTPRVETCFWSKDSGDVDYMGMTTQKNDCFIVDYNSSTLYYRYCSNGSTAINYSPKVQTGWSEWIYGPDLYFNGTKLWSATSWNFSANTQEFHIFRGRTFSKMLLKYVRMYDGDELVFDGFPALVDGVPGLWDRVTGTLFENSGSRPLLYGPVVPTQPGDFTQFKVSGSPLEVGAVTPAYGFVDAEEGDEVECTAPASVDADGIKATLLGWELSYDGGSPEAGDTSPVTVTVGARKTDLVWKWQTQCRLTVAQGADGTITGTDGWKDYGDTVELTATADSGCVFSGWTGDVPAANRLDNPLTLTMDQARAVSAQFDDASSLFVDYNDPNAADDASHGTALMPWKTLAYAVGQAPAESKIVVRAGQQTVAASITVNKKLTITGAGDETVLTALGKDYKITLSVDGIVFKNLTMTNFGGVNSTERLVLSADVTVDGVLFTGFNNSQWTVSATKGTIRNCRFVGNSGGNNAGFYLNGAVTVENCLLANNTTSSPGTYGRGILDIRSSKAVVRNCTVVNNKLKGGVGAVNLAADNIQISNCLIWNNTDIDGGTLCNYAASTAARRAKWISNCTSPVTDLPEGNIEEDPLLKADGLHLVASSPCIAAGQPNDGDVVYTTATDINGVARGEKPTIGAAEYVVPAEMDVTLRTTAALVRAPQTVTLSAFVEGPQTAPLSYAWDFDGDGNVDSTEAEPEISEVGLYYPTLTVTDADGQSASGAFANPVYVHKDGIHSVYVDYTNGNDANDGSAERPMKLLNAALKSPWLVDGDEIVLKAGTHVLDAKVAIAKAITVRGEGENWETVLDGSDQERRVTVSASGALVHSLTLYRVGSKNNDGLSLDMSGDSTISNVVVRNAASVWKDGESNARFPIKLSAGLMTHCWITNNWSFGNSGMELKGTATAENCYFANNKERVTSYHYGIIYVSSDNATLRNCTIVDNQVESHAALYVASANAKIYNNIIWGNVNFTDNTTANIEQNGNKNWYGNCADPLPGTAEKGNIGGADNDPKLLGDRMHFSSDSPCRGEAVAEYATAFDLDGNPRGSSPSIGAFEYVQSDEMLVSINCAAVGQLPAGIQLFGVVDGTYTEPLTYAWSFKGDGTVDSEAQNPVILEQGYFQPTLVVTDADGQTAEAKVDKPIYIHAAGVTTFYVDYENGSDENDGLTKATAWQTIPFAISADIVFPNDEIVLVEGSHPLPSGASLEKPIILRGEGDKENSIIDGQGQGNEFSVKAAGATVCNLTLTNFKGQFSERLAMDITGNSTVSNVVFRDNGIPTIGNCRVVITQSAGLLTHCWVTNNACAGNAGVVLSGGMVENCAFLDNLSDGGTGTDPSVVQVSGGTFRNNTVANNRTKTVGAVHVAGSNVKIINNIIWGNVDYQDASVDRNWSVIASGGSTANVKYNCTTRKADLAGEGNIDENPLFVDGVAPAIRPGSPCRNAGDKALGTTAATDLLGNRRIKGGKIDIGCVEEPLGRGLGILVR